MKKTPQKGLTLVELMVVVAVAGVAGILLIAILVQNNGLFYRQTAKINQGLTLNDVSAEIASEIKSSSGVVTGYPVASSTYLTSSNTVVLSISSVDSSGNPVDQTNDYLVISVDANNPQILREQIFPNALSYRKSVNKVLATNLSQIVFSYLDSSGNTITATSASKINFSVKLINKLGKSQEVSSASATISLRNN